MLALTACCVSNVNCFEGGVVGGVAGLAILAAVAVILWQRRQPSTKRRKRGAKLTAVSELPGGIGDGDAIRRSSLQVQWLSPDSEPFFQS